MLRTTLLRSVDELRSRAAAWDDLWLRSDDTLATSRAKPLALWLEQFATDRIFRAIVVEEGDRMVAALPLTERAWVGPFHAAALPTNEWPGGGALLWDLQPNYPDVARCLVDGLSRLPWSIVLLEGVLPDRACWQRFIGALQNHRIACDLRTEWQAARLPIDHDWPAAVGLLSRKHRQRMTAARRKLQALGGASFQRIELADDGKLESQLLEAFHVEDHGWKGTAGTAILRVPGMFRYLVQTCRVLAPHGNAHLALLRAGETPIAFALGVFSKGVWHSCKIGYDAAFAALTPGHLLHYCLLEELHNHTGLSPEAEGLRHSRTCGSSGLRTQDSSLLPCHAVDYMGPMTEYHEHWRPNAYPVARLAIAPRGILGKLALWGYGHMKSPADRAISTLAEPVTTTV
jgi:CelD/BcsL family acetyltransferase involved in cellulose biosynthesis